MGKTATKTVRGKTYLYYSRYDPETKSKKEVYCGMASNPEAEKKAIRLELEELEKTKKNINEKINDLKARLK